MTAIGYHLLLARTKSDPINASNMISILSSTKQKPFRVHYRIRNRRKNGINSKNSISTSTEARYLKTCNEKGGGVLDKNGKNGNKKVINILKQKISDFPELGS